MSDKMQLNRQRRQRLSDAETAERMLQAGVRFVAEEGLSLSLEHLQMEELIQAAGVSRTSSYRRWPTKSLFAADLLLRLAQATELSADIPGLSAALSAIPDGVFADLGSEQGRRNAVVEILRVVIEADFLGMLNSAQWRSYISLRAAFTGLPDGELRSRVAEALSATEDRFAGARAITFRSLVELMGYRIRRPDPAAWEQLSLTLGAVSTGLLIRAYSDPDAVTRTTERAAFESSLEAPWSSSTLATVGVFLDAVEPDPAAVWSAERITAVRAHLEDIDETLSRILSTGTAGNAPLQGQ